MPNSSSPPSPSTFRLRLLQTTDLHAQLTGAGAINLAGLAPEIARRRDEADLCLLLDCGDFAQGNPLFSKDILNQSPPNHQPLGWHPIVGAFNRMAYDAVALGNHDVSLGQDGLAKIIAQARFPILSTNLRRQPDHPDALAGLLDHALLRRDVTLNGRTETLTIALLAATPVRTLQSEAPDLMQQVRFAPMTHSVAAAAKQMKARGADLVILLAHSGLSLEECNPLDDNCALALARIPEVDVLLCGHQHGLFPSLQFQGYPGVDLVKATLHGKPAVMSGAFASHLGQIDLFLTPNNKGWEVHHHHVSLHATAAPAEQLPPPGLNPLVEASAPYLRRGQDQLDRLIGRLGTPLRSYFAQLAPDPAAHLLADIQSGAMQDLLKDSDWADLPLASAVASQKAPALTTVAPYIDIPKGPFTRRDLESLLPFNNHICALRLTADELRLWLHHCGQMFHHIPNGAQDSALLSPHVPSYRFDHLFGIEATYDLSASDRHPTLAYHGHPLPPTAEVVVVTNTHRLATHPALADLPRDRRRLEPGLDMRSLLMARLKAKTCISLPPQRSWRFKPQSGTTATAEVATAALPYLNDIAHLRPEVLEQTSDTTTRLRLHL